ncbi:antibiotic ABC transporter permease [Methylomonas koyamae]|uniref:Antibiotic ABC transporter permease n=1 Tax=Methylomonas koyamae TaxID=702114 RepID=A0A177N7Q5_9GAMM|nr:ABC transporter permease [Methylomonas koyamae]OAI13533.1 antibiotic ABC transporter permease [Methylomonas koyamae]OAI26003.1 antibiotic ABC transporter permease [Methylomonas koyamae]
MWWRVYALLAKEFLNLLRDKKSRFVLIVPPLVQLFVLSYAATFDLNQMPIAIYNEDSGQASRDLIARFTGAPAFREELRITRQEQIAAALDSRQVLLVLHIGRNFSRDLLGGRQPASLQVLLDGRDSNTAQIAQGYLRSVLSRFNSDWAASRGQAGPPAELVLRAWFNPNLESRWFIVPGIVGLLTLVVTMTVSALSVAREREQGTFDQLLVTPFTPTEILLGKAIPGLIIGVLEASLSIFFAVFWFRVPLLGSLPALYLGIVLYVFSVIGVGLMISSLSLTQQQGLLGGFLVIVPGVILSGYATPIENMPELVQQFTLINPLRYFLVIIRGVFLQGLQTADLLDQYWPLAIIGLFCLSCAGWLFRRRLY